MLEELARAFEQIALEVELKVRDDSGSTPFPDIRPDA
jgi:hypothetical protein